MSKAFSKSMNHKYSSILIFVWWCYVAQKSALYCFGLSHVLLVRFLNVLSMPSLIWLIIADRNIMIAEIRIIPLQLSQTLESPLFGSLIINPSHQLSSFSSFSQISWTTRNLFLLWHPYLSSILNGYWVDCCAHHTSDLWPCDKPMH